jgi:hypothetical protein
MDDYAIHQKNTSVEALPGGGREGRAGYNKHFVISFLKGMVMVLRTIHYIVCPFPAGSKGQRPFHIIISILS